MPDVVVGGGEEPDAVVLTLAVDRGDDEVMLEFTIVVYGTECVWTTAVPFSVQVVV